VGGHADARRQQRLDDLLAQEEVVQVRTRKDRRRSDASLDPMESVLPPVLPRRRPRCVPNSADILP
jgi:hypothetical protein